MFYRNDTLLIRYYLTTMTLLRVVLRILSKFLNENMQTMKQYDTCILYVRKRRGKMFN